MLGGVGCASASREDIDRFAGCSGWAIVPEGALLAWGPALLAWGTVVPEAGGEAWAVVTANGMLLVQYG